jgi:hypothetical protein
MSSRNKFEQELNWDIWGQQFFKLLNNLFLTHESSNTTNNKISNIISPHDTCNKVIKPNFLIVGAAKSGTTALTNLIEQHPDIFMSKVKEPRYFLANEIDKICKSDPLSDYIHKSSVLNIKQYYELFKEAEGYKCRGEASVHYLFNYKSVIPRIQNELGDIKIIILLRNPVLRAISNYYYVENAQTTFEEALAVEQERKAMGYNSFWFHKEQGFYYKSVKAFLENFTNTKVIIYDDFNNNPVKTCKEIFDFLAVNPEVNIKTRGKYNITKIRKGGIYNYLFKADETSIYLKKLLLLLAGKKIRRFKTTWFEKPNYNIHSKTYNSLLDEYLEETSKLENLLNIDLSHWKTKRIS